MHIAPPGQPLDLRAESFSDSWVTIQWQAPNDLGSHGISYYNVTVYKINNTEMLVTETSTEGNETCANITGLQTRMLFKLYVAGIVSLRHGDVVALGQRSDPLLVSTGIEGKILVYELFACCGMFVHYKLFTHEQIAIMISCFAQAAPFRFMDSI